MKFRILAGIWLLCAHTGFGMIPAKHQQNLPITSNVKLQAQMQKTESEKGQWLMSPSRAINKWLRFAVASFVATQFLPVPVFAHTTITNSAVSTEINAKRQTRRNSVNDIRAFDLVNRGYQGAYADVVLENGNRLGSHGLFTDNVAASLDAVADALYAAAENEGRLGGVDQPSYLQQIKDQLHGQILE